MKFGLFVLFSVFNFLGLVHFRFLTFEYTEQNDGWTIQLDETLLHACLEWL